MMMKIKIKLFTAKIKTLLKLIFKFNSKIYKNHNHNNKNNHKLYKHNSNSNLILINLVLDKIQI